MDGSSLGGSACSGTSSGARPSRTTRVKWSSAARAASSPCERVTIHRASASFASSGSPAGTACSTTSRYHSSSSSSEIRMVRPNCSSGGRGQRDVVPHRRAHLLAVPRDEERRREHDLRLEAVGLHHLAPGEQVVELVGAAELDVGLHGDGVVRLHERVEELRDRDRLPARVAPGEVVALEHLRDGHHPRQPDHVREARGRRATRCCAGPPSAPGSRIWSACSRYVSAFRSISSSERIGRSVERPEGSPIRVV